MIINIWIMITGAEQVMRNINGVGRIYRVIGEGALLRNVSGGRDVYTLGAYLPEEDDLAKIVYSVGCYAI